MMMMMTMIVMPVSFRCFARSIAPSFHKQVYNIDSPYFTYQGSVPLTSNTIIHGDIKIIMVQDGKLGISFDDGQLCILSPG